MDALRRGASGYLVKDEIRADELQKAVVSVQEGETVMGRGVASILARSLGGGTTARLYVSESTVKFHIQNASKKLNAHNRTELVHRAVMAGFITN